MIIIDYDLKEKLRKRIICRCECGERECVRFEKEIYVGLSKSSGGATFFSYRKHEKISLLLY